MRKRERGILSVEASIVLTFMTLFVLFLYSFIRVYRAENMVSHATLQAADAMALESYLRENALDDQMDDVVYLANRLTGAATLDAENFESLRSANVSTIAKEKFIAAVSNSEANTNTILTNYGVKDGLSGIDFSTSTVDLDHDDVIVNVSYTLKMQFPIFGATELSVTKSAKAKTFGEILFEITAEPEDPNMGSTSGSGNYQHGTMIQITANPNYGYKFVKWDDGNTDNPRTVPVTDAQKYVAIFEADSFGITTQVSPAGAGTVTGAGTYTYLTTANLNATANPGYHFVKWSVYKHKDSTTSFVSDPSVSQTVDQSYTYTANFEPNTYTIKVATSGAGGNVTVKSEANSGKSLNVKYGTTFDLLQTPPSGYVFKGWKVEGGSTYISPTNGISVPSTYPNGAVIPNNATITYTAYYEIAKYNVTVTSAGHGSVSGGGVYEHGKTVSIKATPADGYVFDYWSVNGSKTTADSSHSFRASNDISYKAHFKECPHMHCEKIVKHQFLCRAIHGVTSPVCLTCKKDCRSKYHVTNSYQTAVCKDCGKTVVSESEKLNIHIVNAKPIPSDHSSTFMSAKEAVNKKIPGVNLETDDFNTYCNGHETLYKGICKSNGVTRPSHKWETYRHEVCDYCLRVETPAKLERHMWTGTDYYKYHYCGKHTTASPNANKINCSGFSSR